ncbi:MAG: hypothetical protein CVU71_03700 [Deltaproteobacteria bacterium HGW-Deltaproteobacteria-6]|nr:MAG: hypothetical protein CVU71_03700 [Deltaproteobacteria bacterium HGW-Deltaproteobacteria-6]
MKDLYNHLKPIQIVPPMLLLDAASPAAVEKSIAGFNSVVITIDHAAKPVGDTGTITLKLEHADDTTFDVAGSYSEVAAADILGATPSSGVIFTLATAAQPAAIKNIGYVGGKKWLKFTLAENDSNATGTQISVSMQKGHPGDIPPL